MRRFLDKLTARFRRKEERAIIEQPKTYDEGGTTKHRADPKKRRQRKLSRTMRRRRSRLLGHRRHKR